VETPIRELLRGDPPVPVAPGAPVAEAVALMRERGWTSIVVSDRDDVVGIFTEKDYLSRVCGQNLSLTDTRMVDVMTPAPEALSPHDDVAYAVNLMATGSLRSIPIVNDTGGLMAVLTAADVMRHLDDVFHDKEAAPDSVDQWRDIGGDG